MGIQDDLRFERFKHDLEASRKNALGLLGSLSYLKVIFDGAGAASDRRPVFACPVKPGLVDSVCKINGISLEDFDNLILAGTSISLFISGFKVEIAVCYRNLIAGLFDGDTLVASVVLTPKRKTTAATNKLFKKARASGVYYALVDNFSSWTSLPAEEKSGKKIAFIGVRNMIYANVLFQTFSDLPLEERVETVSDMIGIDPVGVCSYLLDSDVPDKKGVGRLRTKCAAEKKNIGRFWNGRAAVPNLDERIRLVAEDAGVDPATAATYLVASDIPNDEKRGISGLISKLCAEKKGVANLWSRYSNVSDTEERVRLVAKEIGVDSITACVYLIASNLPDKKGLSTLHTKLLAEKKNISHLWARHSGVSDLRARVLSVAKDANLNPVSVCSYLLASDIPSNERKGLVGLSQTLKADNKNVSDLWVKHFPVPDIEARVRLVAEDAGVDPVTAATYLLASSISEKDKQGIPSLQRKLLAEKKGIVELWIKYSNVPNIEARVRLVAEAANIDAVTACGYISMCELPAKEKTGVSSLRSKLASDKKNVVNLWNKHSGAADLIERVRLVAEEAGIDPVSVCAYLLAAGIPDRKGLSSLQNKLSAMKKGINERWAKYSNISDIEARIRMIAVDADIDPVTVGTYLMAGLITKEGRAGISTLRHKLLAEKKGIIGLWAKHSNVPDIEARVRLVAKECGIDVISACSYLVASGISSRDKVSISGLFNKFRAEKKRTAQN